MSRSVMEREGCNGSEEMSLVAMAAKGKGTHASMELMIMGCGENPSLPHEHLLKP